MEIIKYHDKSSYAIIEDNIDKLDNEFTYRINSYEDLWHLGQILEVYNYKGKDPHVIIPNLIDSQADKRFADNQSSGLKLVCNFLNQFKALYSVFHPHNPEVLEALMNNNLEIIDNSEFIQKVLKELITTNSTVPNGSMYINIEYRHDNKLILISPDAGAYKWLNKISDKISWEGEVWSASKTRFENKLIQQLPTDDFGGKDVLIVDDICINGGTFKGLADLLRKANCGKLFLAVSHITIQNHKGRDNVFSYFDRVYTTNSKYNNYFVENNSGEPIQPKNLEVIEYFDK